MFGRVAFSMVLSASSIKQHSVMTTATDAGGSRSVGEHSQNRRRVPKGEKALQRSSLTL